MIIDGASPASDEFIEGVTGVVLAGGKARRLGGIRKGMLRGADGRTLLERSLSLFGRIFPERLLVANEQEPYRQFGVPVVADLLDGRGAPGGLHAALSASRTRWVFLAGCDMPRLEERVIAALAVRRKEDHPCVALLEGRAEPLHSFWPMALLPRIDRLLREKSLSLQEILEEVSALRIPIEEIEADIPAARESFANINTPGDLVRWDCRLPLRA